jgi:microcystin-dependent protein
VSILAPAKAPDNSLPVGTIIAWGGVSSSVPANWMLCNGKALSKSVYKELFAAIGISWGSSGDKFNLPDLRGRFFRGDDAGAGRDPDAKKRKPSNPGGSATGVGSVQEDMLQNHTHAQTPHSHTCYSPSNFTYVTPSGEVYVYQSVLGTYSCVSSNANIMGATGYKTKSKISTGEETRPKNAAVNFIIKVK